MTTTTRPGARRGQPLPLPPHPPTAAGAALLDALDTLTARPLPRGRDAQLGRLRDMNRVWLHTEAAWEAAIVAAREAYRAGGGWANHGGPTLGIKGLAQAAGMTQGSSVVYLIRTRPATRRAAAAGPCDDPAMTRFLAQVAATRRVPDGSTPEAHAAAIADAAHLAIHADAAWERTLVDVLAGDVSWGAVKAGMPISHGMLQKRLKNRPGRRHDLERLAAAA